jgi:hypothetical protein
LAGVQLNLLLRQRLLLLLQPHIVQLLLQLLLPILLIKLAAIPLNGLMYMTSAARMCRLAAPWAGK